LIAKNNSWAITIPTGIASGPHVRRHEIIALHGAGSIDGAQNYPQCINLEATGGGSDVPAGTLGEALYSETDPGILANIYILVSPILSWVLRFTVVGVRRRRRLLRVWLLAVQQLLQVVLPGLLRLYLFQLRWRPQLSRRRLVQVRFQLQLQLMMIPAMRRLVDFKKLGGQVYHPVDARHYDF